MSYHDNPRVDEIVLTIINDGDGAQCGYTYAERRALAANGLFGYRHMVRNYIRHARRVYGTPAPTDRRVQFDAADVLQDYYRRHVAEG